MRPAEPLYAALADASAALGHKLTKGEWLDIADGFFPKKRKPSKNAPKPRTRDAVFDALATLEKMDLAHITRSGGSRIAKAKQEIVEVMAGAEIDAIVAQINQRAARYKLIHPKWDLTANALVSHWSELGPGPKTQAERFNVYVEPAAWQAVALRLYPGTDVASRAWGDLATDVRRKILEAMA